MPGGVHIDALGAMGSETPRRKPQLTERQGSPALAAVWMSTSSRPRRRPAGSGAQLLQRRIPCPARACGLPPRIRRWPPGCAPQNRHGQALYRTVEFVGHHGGGYRPAQTYPPEGQNAGVGGGFMLHIQGIVGAEVGQDAGFHLLGRPLGHGPVDEPPRRCLRSGEPPPGAFGRASLGVRA